MITRAIADVADGRDLTREEAREVMAGIMAGEATQAQIAGFLVALRAKGETADEIAGCAEAMREHVLPVRPEREPDAFLDGIFERQLCTGSDREMRGMRGISQKDDVSTRPALAFDAPKIEPCRRTAEMRGI